MIRDSAFNDNRINYVDLKNVTYIGAGAFGNNIDYLFDETDTAHYATTPNKRYIFIPETVEFIGDGAYGDGKPDSTDSLTILKKIVGLI